ncbi:hypothetical protein PPYR_08376 [Photinus pyralis]|uniref:Uncharacterized protein n=1 Tax=Photinus pyralis TaxID=7054 RepID=A0A5N4AJ57_PHOPY|nr:endocuticle structural glycoprotein ABD-5-like [Photinus pyralis]XP_031345571.1 endocuticle structural glycoprotein ABD-5-like [Photinus pyralis]KAB0797381.1 hypothetical protein PPYR_08375 [Photinus pyralis]KAB0797382.1 hypothetical protein PPYR_08376 [Photinus pyralis]
MANRNSLIVLVLLFSTVANATDTNYAKIISYENSNHDPNNYHFKYETSDGTAREESGYVVTVNGKNILTVRGKYSYTGTDNVQYVVMYVADEKGYRIEKMDRVPAPPVMLHSPIAPVLSISSNAIKSLQGGLG